MRFPRFHLIPEEPSYSFGFGYPRQQRRFHRNKKMTPIEFIKTMEEFDKFMSSKNTKKDDKPKDPPQHKFTLLETIGLCMFIGPLVGFSYLYMFQAFLQKVEMMVK